MTGTPERRKPTVAQRINTLIPAIILAVLGWMALQIMDIPVIKASQAIMNARIVSIEKELKSHNDFSLEMTKRNSADHHRARGMTPCNGCHDK